MENYEVIDTEEIGMIPSVDEEKEVEHELASPVKIIEEKPKTKMEKPKTKKKKKKREGNWKFFSSMFSRRTHAILNAGCLCFLIVYELWVSIIALFFMTDPWADRKYLSWYKGFHGFYLAVAFGTALLSLILTLISYTIEVEFVDRKRLVRIRTYYHLFGLWEYWCKKTEIEYENVKDVIVKKKAGICSNEFCVMLVGKDDKEISVTAPLCLCVGQEMKIKEATKMKKLLLKRIQKE